MNPYENNTNKHKKEKDIDKFLYNAEKKRVKELYHKVKHYEKIVDIKLSTKRERDDKNFVKPKEENQNSINNINNEISNIEKSSQPSEFNFKFALEKILKHLDKPGSLNKCINLLNHLLINTSIRNIKPIVIIKIFYKISNLPHKFSDMNVTKEIVKLYLYVKNEINKLENKEENNIISKYFNDDNLRELFNLFTIPFEKQVALITDDSFKFNQSLKILENYFINSDDLSDFNEEEVNEIIKIENLIEINYNKDDSEKFDIYKIDTTTENKFMIDINTNMLKESVKRNFLFDCVQLVFSYHKYKWAYYSISSFLTKLYLEKNKLSKLHIEKLEAMLSIIKGKSNNIYITEKIDSIRDEKIKTSALEASHKVTDGRVEKIISQSMDTWEAKQSGISAEKMYINN